MVKKNRGKRRQKKDDPREFESRKGSSDSSTQQKIGDFRADTERNIAAAAAAASDAAQADADVDAEADPDADTGPEADAGEGEQATVAGAPAEIDPSDAADSSGPEQTTSKSTGDGGLSAEDAESPYARDWSDETAARTAEGGSDPDPGMPGHPVSESDNPGTSQTAREQFYSTLAEDELDDADMQAAPIAAQIDDVATGMVPTTASGDRVVIERDRAQQTGIVSAADEMTIAGSFEEAGFDLDDPNLYFDNPGEPDDVDGRRAIDEDTARGRQEELKAQREHAAAAARNGETPMQDMRTEVADLQDKARTFQDDVLVQDEATLADVEPYLETVAGQVDGLQQAEDDDGDTYRVSADPDTQPHPTVAPVTQIDGVGNDAAVSLIAAGYERGSDFAGVDAETLADISNVDAGTAAHLAEIGGEVEQLEQTVDQLTDHFADLTEDEADMLLEVAAQNGADPRETAFQLTENRVPSEPAHIDDLHTGDNYGETPTGDYETTIRGEITHVVDLNETQSEQVMIDGELQTIEQEGANNLYQVAYVQDQWGGTTKVTIPSRSLSESEPGYRGFRQPGDYGDQDGAMPESEALREGDTVELTNFATSQFDDQYATTDTMVTATSETDVDILDRGDTSGPPTANHGGAKPPAHTGRSAIPGASQRLDTGNELVPDYTDTSRALRRRIKANDTGPSGAGERFVDDTSDADESGSGSATDDALDDIA